MNRLQDRNERHVPSKLRVHAWSPSGFLFAGLLALQEDGQQISATFEYDPGYLGTPGAYALDPINLPLTRTIFATDSQFVSMGAIFDAAPDAWGRRVVAAQVQGEGVFRGAFLRGADGIGALVLTPESISDPTQLQSIVGRSLRERPALSQLQRAAQAAAEFESGQDLTEEMRQMLGGSWTIGGARPKAILQDDRPGAAAESSVIAKFPSLRDTIARNRIEWACLAMARDMGMNVPRADLVEIPGSDEPALVLERFDRRPDAGVMHRRHYISAISLASYQPQSSRLDSRQDQLMLSWGKVLELASRVADRPAEARVEMFSRLALNAALQNSDDHLKNFGFLQMESATGRYEIAPVFDVSAQAATRHYLHCSDLGQVYSLSDVIPKARALGIAKGAAAEVEQRILSVLERADQYLDCAGLKKADSAKVLAWIEAGLGPRHANRPSPPVDVRPRQR